MLDASAVHYVGIEFRESQTLSSVAASTVWKAEYPRKSVVIGV